MIENATRPFHPGSFIREKVIPPGMSVTDAATRLGINRTTLSKLLNGKSSLSTSMAIRLEKIFGTDRQQLLEFQVAFDERTHYLLEESIAPRPYVPSFLTVRAKQIHDWPGNNLEARQLLPVLLRKLVHTTGRDLSLVDFPGYDSAERKGNDGVTIAGKSTPWVPQGKCFWEFSVRQDASTKAERDYQARRDSVAIAQRQESTFIFVTPRVWSSKATWEESKKAIKDWKDVRVFDANDLEQWLETSIPSLMWFAHILKLPIDGFETLDAFWDRWSSVTEPPLTFAIFEQSVKRFNKKISDWLEGKNNRLLKVSADSKEEALAFLVALFQDKSMAHRYSDLLTIIDSANTLRQLASSTAPFIPIVHTEAVEQELATVYRERRCIVVVPRNSVESKPDITLSRVRHSDFLQAMVAMKIDRNKAALLARTSGCSLTILRRRLSPLPAIATPPWGKEQAIAQTLVPFALIGVWHTQSDADCEIVSQLTETTHGDVELRVLKLLSCEESPIWSKGQYCGVASKIDSLFATCNWVTKEQIERFFDCAQLVLSETDPALELPEDQRFAAALYWKTRNHTKELRESICETLVILSVHGEQLFDTRFGKLPEQYVSSLVRSLLTPLSLEKLLSHDRDLPWYAEASPREFLEIIEADLRESEPVVISLMKTFNSNSFTSPSRTGLLWALECLAWKNPTEVCLILAKLAKVSIKDNYSNTPINSLKAIFRSWMPQTAAPLEGRMTTLEMIIQRFPNIGWQICMDQIDTGHDFATGSYRPRWRSDASGAGEPVETKEEDRRFRLQALELLLSRQKFDHNMLEDLIQVLNLLDPQYQKRIWTLVNKWADNETDDVAKIILSEMIRKYVLTRWGRGYSADAKESAKALRAKLHVSNPVLQHSWIFQSEWIELDMDDRENDEVDEFYSRKEAKIDQLRTNAMTEIWKTEGFRGIEILLSEGGIPHLAGKYLAKVLQSEQQRSLILRKFFGEDNAIKTDKEGFLRGFLSVVASEEQHSIIENFVSQAQPEESATVYRCAPFGASIWRLVDKYGTDMANRYWRDVDPCSGRHSDEELSELIDRLMKASRPLAAFASICHELPRVETSRLKRVLLEMVGDNSEPAGHWQLNPHNITTALTVLGTRQHVPDEEMAELEFLYLDALDTREYRISNLEQQVANSPSFFVSLIRMAFSRTDGEKDTNVGPVEDPERLELSHKAYRTLDRIQLIPGTKSDESIEADKLFKWIKEVRQLCSAHDRADIGDQMIGQLLSKAKPERDGAWPCIAVCDVMEKITSLEMGLGFQVGVHNARGAHFREVDSEQERELAEDYQDCSKRLSFTFPFVSRVVEGIARDYEGQAKWFDDRSEIEDRTMR